MPTSLRPEPSCPICGAPPAGDRRCTSCHSLERQRALAQVYRDFISEEFNLAGKRILAVAPSAAERRLFKEWGAEIVSIDIRPEVKPDIIANICDMPQVESASFDAVFASYVLCMTYDYKGALAEFARVIKPGGRLFSHDPVEFGIPTKENTDIDVIQNWYGADNYENYKIGSFRKFGDADLLDELSVHFQPRTLYSRDVFTGLKVLWFSCLKGPAG